MCMALFAVGKMIYEVVELYNSDFFTYIFNAQKSIYVSYGSDLILKNELTRIYRHNLVAFVFYACLLVVSILMKIFVTHKPTISFLWKTSWIVAFVNVVAIFLMCWIAIEYASNHEIEKIIHNKTELEEFKMAESADTKSTLKDQKITFIPAGMFVQSVEFTSANNLLVTGYVWQRYDHNADHDTTKIRQGFVFPEATDTEIKAAYKKVYKDYTVYGWHIQATIRETFSYSHYPFDFQNLWVRMWHVDFDKNIILVPDLQAYKSIDTGTKPGIEEKLVLPGWKIREAFFGYMYNNYNTNFGMNDYVGQNGFPELYYCMLIQRDFMATFISEMVPILMVMLILFICVLVAYDEAEDSFFRFNIMELLSLMAAVIFVILLGQLDLRRKIPSGDILYLEYYYFVIYFIIFGILLNYIIINHFKKLRLVTFGDNVLIKILYLPCVLSFVLWATYYVFG